MKIVGIPQSVMHLFSASCSSNGDCHEGKRELDAAQVIGMWKGEEQSGRLVKENPLGNL